MYHDLGKTGLPGILKKKTRRIENRIRFKSISAIPRVFSIALQRLWVRDRSCCKEWTLNKSWITDSISYATRWNDAGWGAVHPPLRRSKRDLLGLWVSETAKLNHLVSDLMLGYRTPCQPLRKMKQLGGDKVGLKPLKSLWLQQLPDGTQTVLTCANGSSLGTLAATNDKIHEVHKRSTIADGEMTEMR